MKDLFKNEAKGGSIKGLAIFLIILAFGAGFYFGSNKSENAFEEYIKSNKVFQNPEEIDMTPFWKVWGVIESSFVPVSTSTKITNQDKVWGAIEGLADSLKDPYTVFLPPSDNKVFRENISGNFEGVGMRIGMKDGLVTVISPLEGTPAKKAGVKSGDAILKIDDTNAVGISLDKAVKLIRGEKGTQVKITVERESVEKPIEINIIREEIKIPTIDTYRRVDGVFVIQLYNFNENSTNLFRSALKEFIDSSSTDLILDLRGNPGGYLQASIDMASWFLSQGKVVVTEAGSKNESSKIHKSKGYNVFNENLNLVVLVDKGSASASEILAGALQDHEKATLIGEKTFGKGSVQEVVEITDETSFKVTIARWLTPNGKSISQNGLTPDIEVKITEEDVKNGKDPQMERAAEFLLEN